MVSSNYCLYSTSTPLSGLPTVLLFTKLNKICLDTLISMKYFLYKKKVISGVSHTVWPTRYFGFKKTLVAYLRLLARKKSLALTCAEMSPEVGQVFKLVGEEASGSFCTLSSLIDHVLWMGDRNGAYPHDLSACNINTHAHGSPATSTHAHMD